MALHLGCHARIHVTMPGDDDGMYTCLSDKHGMGVLQLVSPISKYALCSDRLPDSDAYASFSSSALASEAAAKTYKSTKEGPLTGGH